MPNPLTLIRGLQRAEETASAVVKAEKAAKVGVDTAKADLKITHPLDPKEVFSFPAGTDPSIANDLVRRMLLAKARQGEEKVVAQSTLPADRVAELQRKEAELEHAKQVIKDLESRKDINKVSPGIYHDDATGVYWRVTPEGKIQKFEFTE
jgi:hypothetical protein